MMLLTQSRFWEMRGVLTRSLVCFLDSDFLPQYFCFDLQGRWFGPAHQSLLTWAHNSELTFLNHLLTWPSFHFSHPAVPRVALIFLFCQSCPFPVIYCGFCFFRNRSPSPSSPLPPSSACVLDEDFNYSSHFPVWFLRASTIPNFDKFSFFTFAGSQFKFWFPHNASLVSSSFW